MKSKLYIPDKLNVGYQERENTYTGKLAYVIYYDQKGVLRKEGSWKSWCKHFIGEVDNTPTSGFVLNKGVGGQRESYGWNARNEYIRVYDPRGWEFEISVANLLFILQECTSTKGKGLEGEFVYSWDGKDLVLIPTSCEDYKECLEFTDNQAKKVSKSDVNVGDWVTFKDGEKRIYLGRIECKDGTFDKFTKQHVYYDPSPEYDFRQYRYEKGFTKLATVNEKDNNYSQYLEDFLNGEHCNPIVDIRWDTSRLDEYHRGYVMWDSGEVTKVYYNPNLTPRNRWGYNQYNDKPADEVDASKDVKTLDKYLNCGQGGYYNFVYITHTNHKFVKPVFVLQNGETFEEKR